MFTCIEEAGHNGLEDRIHECSCIIEFIEGIVCEAWLTCYPFINKYNNALAY